MSAPPRVRRPISTPVDSTPTGDRDTITYAQQISVGFGFPVSFTRRLFSIDNPLFVDTIAQREPRRRHRLVFFLDDGVAAGQPRLTDWVDRYVSHYQAQLARLGDWFVIPGGETCKTLPMAEQLQERLMALAIDRQSFVVAIGGGAVLDLVGYAAATVHRGIRLIRIPTTVLAQNDAGVGVKNGVNAFGAKNAVGTFCPPFAVINDLDLLGSLNARDKRAGYAEAVKVGLIRDPAFFDWLEDNAIALSQFEPDAMAYLIRRCAQLHLQHIAHSGDPFETGSARPLDFGHWAAHRLENLSGYELRHGEAVALGMALDVRYSVEVGLLTVDQALRVTRLLEQLGFQLWHPALDLRHPDDGHYLFLDGLDEFREHLGGELTLPLLTAIGSPVDTHQIDMTKLLSACQWLKQNQPDST